MKSVLSNSFSLYNKEFSKIMILSIIIYVPLLLLHALIVNYIYEISRFSQYPGVAGDLANSVIMLVFLTLAQVPFIKFALLEDEDEENLLRNSLSFTMDRIISLYIYSCLFGILVNIGSLLFIIPGLLILLFLYFVPFFIAENGRGYKRAIHKSIQFIKKNFWKALLLILLLTFVQLLFENILIFALQMYTATYFTILIAKIILLLFILPLQTIILTNLFMKWKESDS